VLWSSCELAAGDRVGESRGAGIKNYGDPLKEEQQNETTINKARKTDVNCVFLYFRFLS
jgi:hypothetical protein